jgi:hypothetical protein
MIKARRIRCVGHVTRTGQMGNVYTILVGNLQGREHLEDVGINWRIIKWILRKWGLRVSTGLMWHQIRIGCGLL